MYRSMHSLRDGRAHVPAKSIELDAADLITLRLCDVEVGKAWSLERLTELRKRLEEEARFVRTTLTHDICRALGRTSVDDQIRSVIATKLADEPRLKTFARVVEIAREAEQALMTLVLSES